LAGTLATIDASAAAYPGLPRITMLDTEYVRAVTTAELDWIRAAVDDLDVGRLTWNADELAALASAHDGPDDTMGGCAAPSTSQTSAASQTRGWSPIWPGGPRRPAGTACSSGTTWSTTSNCGGRSPTPGCC